VFASDDFIVQRRAAEAGVGAIFLGKARHRHARESVLVLSAQGFTRGCAVRAHFMLRPSPWDLISPETSAQASPALPCSTT
jgi:hypothetical protein